MIHHNYKTRRNKGTYNEDALSKMRVNEEKKPVRVLPKEKGQMLTYEDLGLTPIHDFDYENYDKVYLFSDSGLVPLLRDKVFQQLHKGTLGLENLVHCALHLLEHDKIPCPG